MFAPVDPREGEGKGGQRQKGEKQIGSRRGGGVRGGGLVGGSGGIEKGLEGIVGVRGCIHNSESKVHH